MNWKKILKYLSILYFVILLSLLLSIFIKDCKAQSLTNLSILKSFNLSNYGLHSTLRSMPFAPSYITGNGTDIDPYLLSKAEHIDSIRYLGLNNKYYELINDIDLSTIPEFVPIPFDNNAGHFSLEGNGYKLTGLKQTSGAYSGSSGSYSLGLFMGKGGGDFLVNDLVIEGFKIEYLSSANQSGTRFCIGLLVSIITNGCGAKITNVIVRNSKIKFVGTPTSFPAQSYHGFIVGSFVGGRSNNYSFIKNCLVEYDSIYFSTAFTPNTGHFIGGIVGNITGTYAYQFMYNASRFNYFYSRTGSTSRKNIGGGLIGEVSVPASTFNYNYSHSNVSDFGNGGLPNSYPWGWGGIFGYTGANNVHTFHQNYAANNQCFGVNQSAGFFMEDNSLTTAQLIDSTYNFCDITSFAEPNTVYGSVRLTTTQYPAPKTSTQLKDINTFIGWDFTNTWSIDSTNNNGYPYLK